MCIRRNIKISRHGPLYRGVGPPEAYPPHTRGAGAHQARRPWNGALRVRTVTFLADWAFPRALQQNARDLGLWPGLQPLIGGPRAALFPGFIFASRPFPVFFGS